METLRKFITNVTTRLSKPKHIEWTTTELEAFDDQLEASLTPEQKAIIEADSADFFMKQAIEEGRLQDAKFWSHIRNETAKGRNPDEVTIEADRKFPVRPQNRS